MPLDPLPPDHGDVAPYLVRRGRHRPEQAGDFYASIKLARQPRGLALDENDLWVAATALALGATLVSRDTDFGGVDGLPVISLG